MEKIKLGVLGLSAHFIKRVLLPLKKSSIISVYAIASRSKKKAEEAPPNLPAKVTIATDVENREL